MADSFTRKKIDVTFTKGSGNGNFAGTSDNVLKLTGLRVSAIIENAGVPAPGTAQVSIYGMPPSIMNELTVIKQLANSVTDNSILIEAGDDANGMSTAFRGTIAIAQANYQSQPETYFAVTAIVGLYNSVLAIPPTSFKGTIDVATIMQTLAGKMSMGFENNGVSVILSNSYLPGTAIDQVRAAAQHAGINWQIINNVLCIWPKNGSRGGSVPIIGPDSGLIGYPTMGILGPSFECIYTPALSFGSTVQLQTSITNADPKYNPNGKWRITGLSHELDSERPGGKWSSQVNCNSLTGS